MRMALEVLGYSVPAVSPLDLRVREQLDRILRSETFRHSEQLRVLLAYLAQKSLDGQADELKEYSIGLDALGRPGGYNPRKDASVRIQAGRLRLKIHEYFRTEGVADPIIFELPKRGFRVVFHDRSQLPPADTLATSEAPVPPTTPAPSVPAYAKAPHTRDWTRDVRTLRRICVSLILGLLVTASFAIYATVSQQAPAAELASSVWNADLSQIWSAFLTSRCPLTLSLGTPLFVSLDGTPIRDWTVNKWPLDHLSPRLELMRQALRATDIRPLYSYNGFGETVGAFRIARLMFSKGKDVSFRRANSLVWDDLVEQDLVLLGSPKSITQLTNLQRLHTQLAFDVEEDSIVNRNPAPGERTSYPNTRQSADDPYDTFALVTRLPGVEAKGHIMILSSPDTQGTLAACEFVTSATHAAHLLCMLSSGARGLPEAYQVLLKITVRANGPLTIVPVAHRVLRHESGSYR